MPYTKKKIPKAVREALWIRHHPNKFRTKCHTVWCPNQITAFDFQAGHNIPESRGGPTILANLVPLCSRCNLSMGNQYTFTEWCRFHGPPRSFSSKLLSCLTMSSFRREFAVSNPSILPEPARGTTPALVSAPKAVP